MVTATLVVGTLVAARIALAIAAWDPGWSALTWDDFTRVAIAQQWAAHPQIAPDLVWLPFSIWVHGAAFLMFGGLVRDNPMLLTAVVNTVALLATAGLVGWSAHRLSGSRTGSLIAFSAVLFSPWGLFASLSGMAESLYYLAVASVILCTIGWLQTGRRSWLLASAASVSVTALSRYEGWTLMAAWAVVLAVVEFGPIGQGLLNRVRASKGVLVILALPSIVPVWWMILNWSRTGNPLTFAREVARYFAIAYGAVPGVIPRLTYYPLPLIRSAPLVALVVAVILIARRRDRLVMVVTSIVALHFAALYISSVLSPVVGAAAIERFLFAMVLALMPLLGYVPWLLSKINAPRTAVVALTAVFLIVTAVRIIDRPLEWTHSPDLLTVAETLGDLGTSDDPLTIVVGPGFDSEPLPLLIRSGDRIRLVISSEMPLTGPTMGPRMVWLEKLPTRTAAIDRVPAATIGRYRVYADIPVAVEVCGGCRGWTLTDENGSVTAIPEGPFVALQFSATDPAAGSVATVSHQIARTPDQQVAVVELRSLYGHGFNFGRVEVQVSLDGRIVFSRDLAERSHWLDISVPVEPGDGEARLTVSVTALPAIEPAWAWGPASTVLIRSLQVSNG